jgi:hypothetical protein
MYHCQSNPKKYLAIIVDMPLKSCNKNLVTKCPKLVSRFNEIFYEESSNEFNLIF